MKEKTHKRDFIAIISSMTHEEINDYIREHGKPPKPVRLYHLIDKEKYTYEAAKAMRESL